MPLPIRQAVATAIVAAHLLFAGTTSAQSVLERPSKYNPAPSPYVGLNVGATGYVFANGVGYDGAEMKFCPPGVGYIQGDDILRSPANKVYSGTCFVASLIHKDSVPSVTAQQFIDTLLGEGEATAISVAPVLAGDKHFAVIYYRAVESHLEKSE